MKGKSWVERLLSACLVTGVLLGSLASARPSGGSIIIPPVDCAGQTCHWELVWVLRGGTVVPEARWVCTPNCLPAVHF